MNGEETKEQKLIRKHSEEKNPYAKSCEGRHLWSEGFRAGAEFIHDHKPHKIEFGTPQGEQIEFKPKPFERMESPKPQGEVSKSMGVNTRPAHQIDMLGYWVFIDPKAPKEIVEKLKMAIAIHLP